MKGYESNKNNRITRTVKVNTEETGAAEEPLATPTTDAPAGESEKDRKARLARLKKLQDEADQARLDALKELVKQEEALEDARVQTIADKRERETAQIKLDADRKARLVTGTEREVSEQLAGIVAERDRKLQELNDKYQKEADERAKQTFEQSMAQEEADEQERASRFEERFQDGLDSEAHYHELLYDSKRAALQAELELEAAYAGTTSKLYTKTSAELLKLEKDRNKQAVDDAKKAQKAKEDIQKLELKVASDALGTTIDLLFADEDARKKHHGLYIALSGAKIIAEGIAEVQAIWSTYSEMGPVGVVLAGIQTGISVARSAMAITKLNATDTTNGYAKGGMTGDGTGMVVSPLGQLMQMSGMSVGPNGRLTDNTGFAIAGVVHEDEYVVPKWQLQDPQVAAVVQWLEARRMRGFADGGPTSAGVATLPVPAASPSSDGDKLYAVLVQMLDVNRSMDARLSGVETWQREFQVVNNLQDTQAGLDVLKQVKQNNGIRSSKG
jgi:hypothetical protein